MTLLRESYLYDEEESIFFSLFGNYNRTREEWQLSDEAFAVATKAVSDDRNERYQSIKELKEAWEEFL